MMSSRLIPIFLPVIIAMTGCAMPTSPGGGARLHNDLARLQQGQQELSRKMVQLESNMVLLESRLQDQQRVTDELQQTMATQKVTGAGQKAESPAAQTGAVSPTSPTALYLQAFSDYASADYSKAIQGFNAFIRNYPGNDYAGNAQYWLGECYYGLGNYQQAVQEFQKVGENYPESGKAPDALLKMVPALRKLNQFEQARKVLEDLIRLYPDSQAAQKAMASH
jgi:tol-pal system protein YbgF